MAKKQAAAAEGVDDILEGKEDDVLAPAKKAKGKAKPAAKGKAKGKAEKPAAKAEKPAKKAAAKKESSGERSAQTEAVRAFLTKVRKFTSFADLAEASGYGLRLVRRTARSMRENGELETTREGTTVFVKAAKK